MKRLSIVTLTLLLTVAFSATQSTPCAAQCCDDVSASPHFFSNPCPPTNACGGRKCWRCRAKLGWRLSGLQSEPTAGDMPVHMPYQTWQLYYYFRPYQARQSDYNTGFEATIREALGIIYEQRKSRIRQTVAEVDPLEYSILPGHEY